MLLTYETLKVDLLQAVQHVFLANTLASALVICAALSLTCYIFNIISHNYSWVDKLWSILPPMYAWHFMVTPLLQHLYVARDQTVYVPAVPLLATLLLTVWGARLTYNFYRKGGYSIHEEDYRWPAIRARVPAWAFQLLNIIFIAPLQNILLLWIATPLYLLMTRFTPTDSSTALLALRASSECFCPSSIQFLPNGLSTVKNEEWALLALIVLFLLIETIADQQQWNFHQLKKGLTNEQRAASKHAEVRDGFIHSGLFRFSRHPNFCAEQSIWWTLYGLTVVAFPQYGYANWTLGGAIFLSSIFAGSTPLTEELSAQKYPAYRLYQRTVSRLLPWFPMDAKHCFVDELKKN